MKLIIGIGNPGEKYRTTRHNVGFQILDQFIQVHNLKFLPAKSKFWFVESKLDTFHFFLVKPTSYVNNSGVIVKDLIEKLNISLEDLLVIYDDTNLDTGTIRIRKSGSDGGHNGIKSIIYHLYDDKFPRIRVGVGNPKESQDLADYVLSDFSEDEIKILSKKYPIIIELIENFIQSGSNGMLNHYSKISQINSPNIS